MTPTPERRHDEVRRRPLEDEERTAAAMAGALERGEAAFRESMEHPASRACVEEAPPAESADIAAEADPFTE